MAIRQITIFECDECGRKAYTDIEAILGFDGAVVSPDQGDGRWGYVGFTGHERLLCSECLETYERRRT